MTDGVPVEVYPVKDVFADELSYVEEVGGDCVRWTLSVSQRVGTSIEKIVVMRLIMPKATVARSQGMTNALLAGRPVEEMPLAASGELH
jgi:hypothetical protein